MKYRISKRLGAYSVAGVLLANNVPVFANNTISSENVSIVDEEQVDVKEPEEEVDESSSEENTENTTIGELTEQST